MPDTNSAAAANGLNPPVEPAGDSIPEITATTGPGQATSRPTESTLVVADERAMIGLLGSRDVFLRLLEENLAADIHVRGNEITITGSPEESGAVVRLFEELVELVSGGTPLTVDSVERSIAMLRMNSDRPADVLSLDILSARGRTIRPKTVNQKRYVDAIRNHTVTVGIGPAGTGKSFLAVAMAVAALSRREVNRIVLTRPAVEAGERLGIALAPIIGALNLEEIVIAGPEDLLGAAFRETLSSTIQDRTLPTPGRTIDVRPATFGDDAVLRGAIATVLAAELGIR